MENHEQTTQLAAPCPAFRVYLCGPFRLERRVDEQWVPVIQEWQKRQSSRTVLKALLGCPGRQARKDALLTLLWPDDDPARSGAILHKALTRFRKIFAASFLEEGARSQHYQLEGQQHIWVDVDAARRLLARVEQLGRTSQAAFPLLEEAVGYLSRGSYLEEEDGFWVYERRKEVDEVQYNARLWLAEAAIGRGAVGQAEDQWRALLATDPIDEDVLEVALTRLHQHGMTAKALRLYAQIEERLEKAEEGMLSQRIHTLVDRFQYQSAGENGLENSPAPFSPANVHPVLALYPFSQDRSQEDTPLHFGEALMDTSRRTLAQSVLKMTTAAVISSYDLAFFERLFSVLEKPSALDSVMFSELEAHTHVYWHHRLCALCPATDLLTSARAHLSLLLHFLQGSLSPHKRSHLCALGSEMAQVIGMLLFDLRAYVQARNYFHMAISMAQEAGHAVLEMVAWGNLSFAWSYDDHPQEALPCIQQACKLARTSKETPLMIQAEFASREAEIFSLLGEQIACLDALKVAAQCTMQETSGTLLFGIHFDYARQLGYEGACLRRLYCVDNQKTRPFLYQAEQVLGKALASVSNAQLLRRSTVELDLAEVFCQQQEFEGATQHALQAARITERTGSQMMSQRLRVFRQHIEHNTSTLQALDQQLAVLTPSHTKE